ncbi:MAG: hypothetical protein M3521_14975 [Acidobacteriota bacterium]|nr:hypothetical protein [Acidobacteriota bacterium]
MLKNLIFAGLLILAFQSISVFAQDKTIINNQSAKKMLLGKHRFSLQWISWDYFGTATVTDKKGVLYLKGEQKGRDRDDYLTIDGVVTQIDEKEFKFNGKIVTKVSHLNEGKPCPREGEVTFAITKNRRYWRLKDMSNPCDDVLDYVDIFFR